MNRKQNRKKGQTALEYMLVIGVVVIGLIFTAKNFFIGKDSAAGKLMDTTIKSATDQICTGDHC